MSDTNDAGKIARLALQRTQYRDAARKAHKDRKDALKLAEGLRAELDGLKSADPSGRVKELETELRTLRHRATFDKLAKARGAKDEDLDDLFALSGYRAEGEAPDEEALGKLLDDQAAHPSRKRYFAAAGDDDDDEGRGGDDDGEGRGRSGAREEIIPERRPAPDAGRGARHRAKDRVVLTADQLADPKFMLDPRNAELKANARVRL